MLDCFELVWCWCMIGLLHISLICLRWFVCLVYCRAGGLCWLLSDLFVLIGCRLLVFFWCLMVAGC